MSLATQTHKCRVTCHTNRQMSCHLPHKQTNVMSLATLCKQTKYCRVTCYTNTQISCHLPHSASTQMSCHLPHSANRQMSCHLPHKQTTNVVSLATQTDREQIVVLEGVMATVAIDPVPEINSGRYFTLIFLCAVRRELLSSNGRLSPVCQESLNLCACALCFYTWELNRHSRHVYNLLTETIDPIEKY